MNRNDRRVTRFFEKVSVTFDSVLGVSGVNKCHRFGSGALVDLQNATCCSRYRLCTNFADTAQGEPGVDYLAAYWMGRHHGFIANKEPAHCLAFR